VNNFDCRSVIFVADEPLTVKTLAEVTDEDKETVQAGSRGWRGEYEQRESGLQIREIAGGWQLATRTEFHEEVRKFLKTRPSAKLVFGGNRDARRYRL
jgi:segregation and condensation protein B